MSSAKRVVKNFLTLSKRSSLKSRRIGLIIWDLCHNPILNKMYNKSKAIEYIKNEKIFSKNQSEENIEREIHRAYEITKKCIEKGTILSIDDKKKKTKLF